jgi:hypothetical protein
MPTFNYKANKKTDRKKSQVALKRAKKQRPGRNTNNFATMPTRIMDVRKIRHDIEDN